jgi:hypothetical protein
MKNGVLLLNRVFYLYEIIGVHLYKNTIMNQLNIHDLCN